MIRAYDYPTLTAFKNPKLIGKARHEIKAIKKELKGKAAQLISEENSMWIRIRSRKRMNPQPVSRIYWMPKLYICVASKDYFRAIKILIAFSERSPLHWKFCKKIPFLSRPDKIVVYFKDVHALKKTIPKLRLALNGVRFHSFSHAGSTCLMGYEKKGHGFFVGADPHFLKMSWRLYRIAILSGILINREFVEDLANTRGCRPEELFNLSCVHEGPIAFRSKPSQIKLIRKFWKSLF